MTYVLARNLNVGDLFAEHMYVEVWQVVEASIVNDGMSGCRAICIGSLRDIPQLAVDDVWFFGAAVDAYEPLLYKVTHFWRNGMCTNSTGDSNA